MKLTFTVLLLTVSFLHLKGQTNNSPYSLLGIGDIDDSYYNRTSGLSNTGISYRSNRYLIANNPASYSALDNDFFAGEIGGRATFINYTGGLVSTDYNQSFDIAFKKLAIGIKPAKHWGTSIGLIPYSSQNYQFNTPVLNASSSSLLANNLYEGSGGLYKAYWGNSYEFFKHVSLGFNLSYLFGSLQQKDILQGINGNELVSTHNDVSLSNFYLDYGIQVYGKLGKKFDYSLGATYAQKSPLNTEVNQTVLNNDSISLYNYTSSILPFYLPVSVGFGGSLTYNKRVTFLADYKYQNWSSVANVNQGYTNTLLSSTDFMNYRLQNSSRFSAGLEYSKKKTYYNTLVETVYYQAGFYMNNSYLNLYGQQIKDIGGSLGMGVNSKRTALSYNFSLQYGVKGIPNIQLIEEKYVNFTISISYRDFWLTKGRKFF